MTFTAAYQVSNYVGVSISAHTQSAEGCKAHGVHKCKYAIIKAIDEGGVEQKVSHTLCMHVGITKLRMHLMHTNDPLRYMNMVLQCIYAFNLLY